MKDNLERGDDTVMEYDGYFYTTKKGVRVFVPNNKEQSLELAKDLNKNAKRSKNGELSAENKRIAKNAYERFKELEIRFSKSSDYETLCEMLDNNLSPEEKGSPLVCDEIFDNIYIAINFGHNKYIFIGVYPIGSLDYDDKALLDDEYE